MRIFVFLCLQTFISTLPIGNPLISKIPGNLITAGGAVRLLAGNHPHYATQPDRVPGSEFSHLKDIIAVAPLFTEIDESIRLFAKPSSIVLPRSVQISKNLFHFRITKDYTITDFIARGADGAVYEGYDHVNPQKKLIFKFYIGAFYSFMGYDALKDIFLTEVWALKKISRLIDADYRNLVIVQPKIEGITLKEHLSNLVGNNQDQYDETIKEYLTLAGKFRKQWNFIHGDVRPSNVIVDDTGKMHLIDFGRSRSISLDKLRRSFEEEVDDDIARKAISYDYEWSGFSSFDEWKDRKETI